MAEDPEQIRFILLFAFTMGLVFVITSWKALATQPRVFEPKAVYKVMAVGVAVIVCPFRLPGIQVKFELPLAVIVTG